MPGQTLLVSMSIAVEVLHGMYARIATRSSFATLGLAVGGGVVDSDFRGEVKVVLHNHGAVKRRYERGEKLAQMILETRADLSVSRATSLSATGRGTGGFGSTTAGVP